VHRGRGLLHRLQRGKGKTQQSYFAFLATDATFPHKQPRPVRYNLNRSTDVFLWLTGAHVADAGYSVHRTHYKRKDGTNQNGLIH